MSDLSAKYNDYYLQMSSVTLKTRSWSLNKIFKSYIFEDSELNRFYADNSLREILADNEFCHFWTFSIIYMFLESKILTLTSISFSRIVLSKSGMRMMAVSCPGAKFNSPISQFCGVWKNLNRRKLLFYLKSGWNIQRFFILVFFIWAEHFLLSQTSNLVISEIELKENLPKNRK